MIIYIRHGKDETTDKYSHDNEIVQNEDLKIRKKIKKIIERYGEPEIIYVTPFRRGIQTIEIVTSELKNNPEIIVDNDLSRFFNQEERNSPKIHPITELYSPPMDKNKKTFRERVKSHVSRNIDDYDSKKVIWCVTHALVIKTIAKFLKIKIPSHLTSCFCLVCG